MELAGIVFKQTVTMFILMAIGYFLYKGKIITNHCSKELSKMLVSVVIPAVIIKSYAVEFSWEKLRLLGMAGGMALIALVLAMIVCHFLYGGKKKVDNFGISFSNAGFVGIPLVSAVLGQEAVFYVSIFVALLNLLQQTYGVMVMTQNTSYIRLRKILTNPILISLAVGLLLFVLPVEFPGIATECIAYIAGLNTPVAMLILGVYLAQSDLKDILTNGKLYASSAVRLLVLPVLTVIIFKILPVPADIKMIELIAAATPVGSNVAVFAQLHDLDYGYAAKMVCNSTILSIFTLPVVVFLASSIF